MRAVVTLVLCGCGRIAFDPIASDSGAANALDAFVQPCVNGSNADDFSDGIACTPWGSSTENGGATLGEGNGELEFSLPVNFGAYADCVANVSTQYAGGSMLEVTALPTATSNSYLVFHNYYINASENVSFFFQYGTISAQTGLVGSEVTLVSRPWSATNDRFVRWRALNANTQIAETSPDARSWTKLAIAALPTPTAVRPDFVAGTNANEPTVDRAAVGGYNTCPP